MVAWMPYALVVLALIVAVSIAFIAWEITDEDLHEGLNQPAREPGKDDPT